MCYKRITFIECVFSIYIYSRHKHIYRTDKTLSSLRWSNAHLNISQLSFMICLLLNISVTISCPKLKILMRRWWQIIAHSFTVITHSVLLLLLVAVRSTRVGVGKGRHRQRLFLQLEFSQLLQRRLWRLFCCVVRSVFHDEVYFLAAWNQRNPLLWCILSISSPLSGEV